MNNVISDNMSAGAHLADYGGLGQNLLFLHANGYPPACYKPLLDRLTAEYHVFAMPLRPLWPSSRPEDLDSWKTFSEDLLKLLAGRGLKATIAVGHSMGAITALRAALTAPWQFAALILLEPVIFPPYAMLGWALARLSGLGPRVHPMIRAARKRRRSFSNHAEAFERYRSRQNFRYLSDDALRSLIEGILESDSHDRWKLAYSPEWEMRVYYTSVWNDWDLWKGIPGLAVPTLLVRGAESDTLWQTTAQSILSRNPAIWCKTVSDSTHLLPLERPVRVAELINGFLTHEAPLTIAPTDQTRQKM